MSFDDIPEDKEWSEPCECGGSITLRDGFCVCDTCDFRKEVKP